MFDIVFSQWTFMRVFRLVFALVFVAIYFSGGDNFSIVAATFFGIQALFNVGCCGANGCSTPVNNHQKNQNDLENVTYKEID